MNMKAKIPDWLWAWAESPCPQGSAKPSAVLRWRDVCLAAIAVLGKQWAVYLEQDLNGKARPTVVLAGLTQQGRDKESSISWVDL